MSTTTLPVIERKAEIPKSGDYQFLYEQGLEWISRYSGDLWNNYNLGDPGITILQNLCYALTELGYKTNLPIQDILTKEDGQINYEDRFVKPQNILPTNPVTLIDFKKKLIDEIIELKQVYFNLDGTTSSNTLEAFYEVKPEYLQEETLKNFKEELRLKVEQVLSKHQNLGQLFGQAVLLNQQLLNMNGTIYLEKSIVIEDFIAQLLFQLNNYLSPYPDFQSYEALLAQGKTNDEIMEGPLLNGGFLKDENFTSKRKSISIYELMTILNKMEGVISVNNISVSYANISNPVVTAPESTTVFLDINYTDAPYFELNSFFDVTNPLQIIQNGRQLSLNDISKEKVIYRLGMIIPRPHRKTDFDAFLPTGTFKNIETYYSIQHQFPEIYELNKNYKRSQKDPARIAKTMQLKAYLALFEQIMANSLSQLSHIDDLFSFESGRTIYQLAGKTYYFQDLYDVPGIQEILKDVSGYVKQGQEQNYYEDWKAYKRDNLNPYRQQLMEAIEAPDINLTRKNKVLQHLLARFGEKYESTYLNLTNPGYGNDQTAEVVHISSMLKSFSLLSANRARSYFLPGISPGTLYAGFELLASQELNINSYYQGLCEQSNKVADNNDSLVVSYYKDGQPIAIWGKETPSGPKSVPDGWIEIYYENQILFSFQNEEESIDENLPQEKILMGENFVLNRINFLNDFHCSTLLKLINQTQGFVFIDNIRLFKNFLFTWTLTIDAATVITSPKQTFYQLQKNIALINSGTEVKLQTVDNSVHFTIATEYTQAVIFEMADQEPAEITLEKLQEARQNGTYTLSFKIFLDKQDQTGETITANQLNNRVSAIFPNWVPLLQENEYQKFLTKTLRSICPINTLVDIYSVNQTTMDDLLKSYSYWMQEIINTRSTPTLHDLNESTEKILKKEEQTDKNSELSTIDPVPKTEESEGAINQYAWQLLHILNQLSPWTS